LNALLPIVDRVQPGVLERAVGGTPVLHLARFGRQAKAPLYAKLELRHPTGSGKDRIAAFALDALRRAGRLANGQAVVVPSTGNLAVSVAWAAATRGHPVHAVLPGGASIEMRQLCALYGAQVVRTDAALGLQGARTRAAELASDGGHCLFDPCGDDLALPALRPLAEEIASFSAAVEAPLSGVVCGLGTGVTAAALSRYLPGVPVIAVEPAESAVHLGQPRGPHKVHGIGVGFSSVHLAGATGVRFAAVSAREAWQVKRELSATEGLLVGPTTGAVFAAARALSSSLGGPLLGLAMDTGERVFSQESLFP